MCNVTNLFAFLGREKELDSFVLVAVLGFHSMYGSIISSQFIYDPAKPKKNYMKGSWKVSWLIIFVAQVVQSWTFLMIQQVWPEKFCQPPLNDDTFGAMPLVAFKEERNVVRILEDESDCTAILHQLQADYLRIWTTINRCNLEYACM